MLFHNVKFCKSCYLGNTLTSFYVTCCMMRILRIKMEGKSMKELTPRELEVLNLISEGLTNKQIAENLFISVHTVKAEIENIYFKLGVHNRVLAALLYLKIKQAKLNN